MQGRSVPRLAGVLVLLLVVSAEVEGQSNKVENHYKILDVEPGASASEIRSAYHKESLKWHPDKNQGSKEAEKMFIKVQEAYQVLKDPNRRAAFDAAWKYQQRSRSSCRDEQTSGGGESGQTRADESFDINFDELMEMMRQWDQQNSTLRTAKLAFTSFVTDLSDYKMRYYLDKYLPIDRNDSLRNNMVKRVLRWIAWSGRGLMRRFLQRLAGADFKFESSQGGHGGGQRGYGL